MKYLLSFLLSACVFFYLPKNTFAQNLCFPNQNQKSWDVLHYELHLDFDLKDTTATGFVVISIKKLDELSDTLALDFKNASVENIQEKILLSKNRKEKKCNAVFANSQILIPTKSLKLNAGDTFKVKVYFNNKFQVSSIAPWQSGLTADEDNLGHSFWGFSCQGDGASLLFPCKDVLADKPDLGVDLFYAVPQNLKVVGNGQLISSQIKEHKYQAHYKVHYPICNYNITFYIGDFVSLDREILGKNGVLKSRFSPLRMDKKKAEALFPKLDMVIEAFEYWCGAYPFYKDGCNFVQAPYLGMEHQSAIAYGNNYQYGYDGKSRSECEEGMWFDFILVHELAHEWWGNSVSVENNCDYWINEGFATYMEVLYLEYVYGKAAARNYHIGKRKLADNNFLGMGDCTQCQRSIYGEYDKPAAMIHQIRLMMKDDKKFLQMLQDIQQSWQYKITNTEQVQQKFQTYTGFNLSKVFEQYLHQANIPTLILTIDQHRLSYYWSDCVSDFDMPITVFLNGQLYWLYPKTEKQILSFGDDFKIEVNKEWLVNVELVKK